MRERTPFPKGLVSRLPNLKLLLTTGARNAVLDVQACREQGVQVAGTKLPPSSPDSTTQHCVALILALARNLAADDLAMKSGLWQTTTATSLAGKVFGTVGLGRLGAAVSRIMHLAFGMTVVAWSPNLTQEAADARARELGLPATAAADDPGTPTFRAVSRDELFRTADVVNVQLVLSERSRGLVGAADLARMKPSALLVNAARGPIVDEAALLGAARAGTLGGVALDVYGAEPLDPDSPWRTTRWGAEGRCRVLLTPHMGYVEQDALDAMYRLQVDNVRRWQAGEALLTVFETNGY